MDTSEQQTIKNLIERYQVQMRELTAKIKVLSEVLMDLHPGVLEKEQGLSIPLEEWNLANIGAKTVSLRKRGFLPMPRPKDYPPGEKPYWDALEIPPKEYRKELTQVQLAVLALANCEEGDKYELADYILNIDLDKDKKTLVQAFSGILSRMSRAGLINAEKRGPRNIYSIKK